MLASTSSSLTCTPLESQQSSIWHVACPTCQVRSTSDYPDPPATLPLFPVVHKATVISLQHPYTPILRTQYHEMTGWPDRLIDRLIAAINYRRMEVKRQNYIVSCDRGLTNIIKS